MTPAASAIAPPIAPPIARRPASERPILFSGPMVKAIFARRKTQTRRLIAIPEIGITKSREPKRSDYSAVELRGDGTWRAVLPDERTVIVTNRYGQPGDRLWVRETWYCDHCFVGDVEATNKGLVGRKLTAEECVVEWRGRDPDGSMMYYRADGEAHTQFEQLEAESFAWRPSIHMPRWASRIVLEVTDVRAERLQSITAEDAKAEGLACVTKDGGRTWKHGVPDRDGYPGTDDTGWPWHEWEVDPVKAYAKLWDKINGARASWASNPWVWVVSFRRAP